MKLTVPDTARLFTVPEETVYRWVRDGVIPHARVNEQVVFNRTELLEWATARGQPVSIELIPGRVEPACTLASAFALGGVHRLPGRDLESVLRALVEVLPVPESVDREELFEVLLAREGLGSTGVGDGIAIPHVSRPLVVGHERASVTLCYLDEPADFAALDGRPVTTVFASLTPTVRAHLHLLSRLSAALHDPAFRAAVLRRAARDEIVHEALRVEAAFTPPNARQDP